MGEELELVDVSRKPLTLETGDVIVCASDGIHTLDEVEIARIVEAYLNDGAAAIAQALLRSVEAAREPGQDNTTIAVVRVSSAPG